VGREFYTESCFFAFASYGWDAAGAQGELTGLESRRWDPAPSRLCRQAPNVENSEAVHIQVHHESGSSGGIHGKCIGRFGD